MRGRRGERGNCALNAPIDRGLTARAAYTPFGGYARLGWKNLVKGPANGDFRTAAWAAALWLGSIGAVSGLWLDGYRLPPIWAVLFLGAVATIAERQSVAVTERTTMSVSFLPLVFSALAFGPLGGFAVGALSNVWDLRESRLKWMVYTPIRGLTAAFAGFAAWTLVPNPHGLGQYLLANLAASVAHVLAGVVFVGITAAVRGVRLADVGFAAITSQHLLLSVPLYVPILALFVFGYDTYSLWLVLVFFVPTLAAQRLLHLYQEERILSRDLAAANTRLRNASLSFATALVATLDARDQYTAGHSAAVAIYARDIAERMGLPEEQQALVHLCGLVHDIGKIGLPAGLLEKPGPLTLDERRQMEKHSEIGWRILRNVDDYSEIAEVVRFHHERIDGMGYPDRLHGNQIPLLARIIGVADAYDAMTSDRPYRAALPSRIARLRLAQAVETQFDTAVVAAFEAILAAADEDYRSGEGSAFLEERSELEHAELPVSAALDVLA